MSNYTINEDAARRANDLRSISDYKPGSATAGYRAQVAEAADTLKRVQALCQTDAQRERAEYLFDRYAATLANAINRDNEISARCPSVMVCGPANFPVRKKEKQIAAWQANAANFEKAEHYLYLLEHAHQQPINSNDPEILDVLTAKVEKLQRMQDHMKQVNAYYRKNKTFEGAPNVSPAEIAEIKRVWDVFPPYRNAVPYPPYALSNNNANIKRLQQRIASLQAAKESTHEDEEHEGYTYHEDAEQMRVQLIFDGKPDDDTRALLKSYGFRWSPRNGAWQRQLTENGKRAARQIMRELDAASNDDPA